MHPNAKWTQRKKKCVEKKNLTLKGHLNISSVSMIWAHVASGNVASKTRGISFNLGSFQGACACAWANRQQPFASALRRTLICLLTPVMELLPTYSEATPHLQVARIKMYIFNMLHQQPLIYLRIIMEIQIGWWLARCLISEQRTAAALQQNSDFSRISLLILNCATINRNVNYDVKTEGVKVKAAQQ